MFPSALSTEVACGALWTGREGDGILKGQATKEGSPISILSE